MAMFMAAEKFLAKYLGGRYQEDGTPEVVARLKEITVDPKTVTVSKVVDAGAVGVPAVAWPCSPAPGNTKPASRWEPRRLPLGLTTTIREEAAPGPSAMWWNRPWAR